MGNPNDLHNILVIDLSTGEIIELVGTSADEWFPSWKND